jgi:hypothetical protein
MRKNLVHTYISIFLLLTGFSVTRTFAQKQTEPVISIDSVSSGMQLTEDSENLFGVISDSVSIKTRSIPDSVVKKLRADDAYWYVNTVPERQKQKEAKLTQQEKWYQKEWFTNLLWFLIIGSFVAILIIFFASSNIRLFRKRPVAAAVEDGEITEETIFSLDYDKEIQQAVNDQNYRLAIRLWYLRTLKDLAEKKLIQYKQEKTNSDYVAELFKTSYHKNFFSLTRSFEYIWYGRFELSGDRFVILQKDFINFKQQLQ